MKKAISLLFVLLVATSLSMTALAADFADVDSGAWYADAVDYVVSNKLMGGYNNTTFGPNDTLSRAMVVQVLYNKEGQPVPSGKHEFTDVPADQWFNNAVTWGTQKGVMGGYGNGKFGPNDNVTLEQLAVILWNYSGNPAFTGKADSVGAHSDWADNGLAWAVENGVLANVPYSAVTDGATRAQTALMLTNYLSGSKPAVPATGISLDITSHKMGEDWTQYLTATLSPAGAKDTITWTSSDPKVATVNEKGKVSGVAGGTAIITAKIPNGKTATCKIEVWHSHKLTSSIPATATEEGVDTYTCSGCGHSYETRTPRRFALSQPIDDINDIKRFVPGYYTGDCYKGGNFRLIFNSANGVILSWGATNTSNKEIKYITFTINYYNRVGDPAYDSITGKSSYTARMTGPIGAEKSFYFRGVIGYGGDIHYGVITNVKVEYMDGSTVSGNYGYTTWHNIRTSASPKECFIIEA